VVKRKGAICRGREEEITPPLSCCQCWGPVHCVLHSPLDFPTDSDWAWRTCKPLLPWLSHVQLNLIFNYRTSDRGQFGNLSANGRWWPMRLQRYPCLLAAEQPTLRHFHVSSLNLRLHLRGHWDHYPTRLPTRLGRLLQMTATRCP